MKTTSQVIEYFKMKCTYDSGFGKNSLDPKQGTLAIQIIENALTERDEVMKELEEKNTVLSGALKHQKAKVKELEEKLAAVIDACEDKGGQFRAWHSHLRATTKAGQELLNKNGYERRDTSSDSAS